jgi:hypothetical protein
MKNAGLADPLLWNTEVQERDTKNTESTICVAKMLLSVSVSELLLLGCSFGTMVLNKIVPIPLFQRWELILTDRNRYDWLNKYGNRYDWLKKYTVIEVVSEVVIAKVTLNTVFLGFSEKLFWLCLFFRGCVYAKK